MRSIFAKREAEAYEHADIQLKYAYDIMFHSRGEWKRICISLLAVIILLIGTIITLLPLKTTEIRWMALTTDKNTFVNIYPDDLPKTAKQAYIREQLRKYVAQRHEVDGITDRARAIEVYYKTASEARSAFKEEFSKQKEALAGVRRQIEIVSDVPLPGGAHRVEFQTIDTKDGKTYQNDWVVILSYRIKIDEAKKQGKSYSATPDELRVNPLGLEITKYIWEPKVNRDSKGQTERFDG